MYGKKIFIMAEQKFIPHFIVLLIHLHFQFINNTCSSAIQNWIIVNKEDKKI